MSSNLHTKRAGQGPPVILLHGLFGSGANLGALSRCLRDTYTVFAVDLPGHGRSSPLVQTDLCGMAQTIQCWMEHQNLPDAHFVGHSLGGKVAMQLALRCPQKVRSLVVADIAPVQYAAQHDAVFAALTAVADGHCRSREQAAACMAPHLADEAVIQFLLASLQRNADGSLGWRFDLPGITAAYAELRAAPALARQYVGPVLFIKGGASHYIEERHTGVIKKFFPAAQFKVMANCGHWLHVQKPQLFNAIVARFLAAQKPRMLAADA